jgi:curved DNA-binding protein CbpA
VLSDREIFRLRDELAANESPEITFYDFLGIKPSASQDEINKAYRKKSRSLHPDKVKQQLAAERAAAAKADAKASKSGVKVAKKPSASEVKAAVKRASDRQARLSIVANVLRGAGRERYDYFLANGFPKWKGTEYYYSRYRPGFGSVLVGVFLFAGGAAHYIALYMGWKRQREFVERYIKYARNAAWGENLGLNIPGVDGQPAAAAAAPQPAAPREQQMYEDENGRAVPINRRMRRLQEKDARKEADKERVAQGGRKGKKGASKPSSGAATPRTQEAGAGPIGSKKRVVAENGKVLVVDSLGDVYLEQEDEDGNMQEFLLDVSSRDLNKPPSSRHYC